MTPLLAGGDAARFERYGPSRYYRLRPVTLQGYLVTIVYAAFVTVVSLFLANGDLGALNVTAWVLIVTAASFVFIMIAVRMSARAGQPRRRRR